MSTIEKENITLRKIFGGSSGSSLLEDEWNTKEIRTAHRLKQMDALYDKIVEEYDRKECYHVY